MILRWVKLIAMIGPVAIDLVGRIIDLVKKIRKKT